jgi:TonB family protein
MLRGPFFSLGGKTVRRNGLVLLACLATTGILQSREIPSSPSAQPKTSLCGLPGHASSQVPTPQLVHMVDPKYPKEARRAKLEGFVSLGATIAKDGTVKDLHVLDGEPILANAAEDAVKRWRYEPIVVHDVVIDEPIEITVNFALSGHGGIQSSQRVAESSTADATGTLPVIVTNLEPYPIYGVGGDVKAPKALHAPDPPYAESALKARKQGTVELAIVVTPEGSVRDVELCKSLDFALDQNAIASVGQWRFEPATKDGKPVAVYLGVEVTFRLYN